MEWRGDETRFGQLCQLFKLASSPDNAVQQQVMQQLNGFSQLPDFNLYLATIFAEMQGQEEVVRQGAGLCLKTSVSRAMSTSNLAPGVAEYIQVLMLKAVRDPNRVIRHTAGTVITTMVEKLGVSACFQTLDKLAEFLGDVNPEAVDGSFSALNKICEDQVTTLKQLWEAPAEYTQPFVSWSTERLLPRVFEYASPGASAIARQNAIECLNHFALNWVLNDTEKYVAFQPYAQRYVEVLGVLANDADVTVLTHVCKGFVCIIENNWNCLSPHIAQVVVQYMLKASQHPEYAVRQEALEVWTPCTNSHQMLALVKPILPELVPVLLINMVYSNADYMGMEQAQVDDDNAAVPDQLEDIKPRFHKEQGDDEDDGGGQNSGGAWGAEWTVRKAAASSLDHLANAFSVDILPIVLPLIQQKLEAPSWEVQESGVLALGAIAFGCMQQLVQFLPKVMELLLRLCRADKPLLRSISCWCCSRFSSWICYQENNPDQQAILREVLKAILERVLDKNKRVQEAACSAFATLEEEARHQLVPFLDDIVAALARAFQYYQAKNLLILYDAVGTLSEAVGRTLAQPQYVQAIMGPLMARFDALADNDRSIIALFECLSSLSQNLGEAMLPIVPRLSQRCVRLILEGARAAQMAQQNPNEFEKPDREVMAASIDLLAGIVEGLGEKVQQILAQQNFIMVAPEVLKDTALQVKQSAFALVGDCAKNCIEYLKPFLPQILPLCSASLRQNASATVSNNASWAIGEICVKVGPEFMGPYLDDIMTALAGVLMRQGGHYHQQQQLLTQNVCITIGRLGVVCGPQIAKGFGGFAQRWCLVMKHTRLDHEKVNAFQGLCNMVRANPAAALGCVPELAGAIASFYPAPEHLEPSFREILNSYKQQLGASWAEVYAKLPDDTKVRLHHMYSLGP